MWRLAALVSTAWAAGSVLLAAQGPAAMAGGGEDKYVWLEDVSGPRAMGWVKDQNARTAAVLEKDPRYAGNFADALKVAEDPRRLAVPQLRGGEIYNEWRDQTNPRGLLRKTSVADYLTATPHWTTVLDFDALGRAEKTGWVSKGLQCLYPGDGLCVVELSAGGEDATTDREFDLKAGRFVEGGFVSPHSKQGMAWLDKDTVLLARDWGAGTMTSSGYPFVVKVWKRGTPMGAATEVFRGKATDVGVSATVLEDAQGERLEVFRRGVTFFEQEYSVRTPRGVERLGIPTKADVVGLLRGRVLVSLREDWTPAGGTTFKQGSLVEMQLAEVVKDPGHLKPAVVFQPTAESFLQEAMTTRDQLVLTTLEHVKGRAAVYTPGKTGWTARPLAVPDNAAVGLVSASNTEDRFFLDVESFVTPPALWLGEAAKGEAREVKSEPARFDAAGDAVEQFEATSKDGTKVPYFVVHRKGMTLDGSNPTLLEAYGGFEVSLTPDYNPNMGKLWLERGGVYVQANLRGGGEFGPAWHEAGLKTHRQRIYDDFAAVGQDLVTRKITSPKKLGIIGGSNGGLLMGVEMEQHPELWKAVVIEVPLLDMVRFEQIAAGASWVGEYGSMSVPEERSFLEGISPYANLRRDVTYPVPLIWTTTKDDRVGPQHARKFAAKMGEFGKPYFYWEVIEGGHGSGADLRQESETRAMTYTYLQRELMP